MYGASVISWSHNYAWLNTPNCDLRRQIKGTTHPIMCIIESVLYDYYESSITTELAGDVWFNETRTIFLCIRSRPRTLLVSTLGCSASKVIIYCVRLVHTPLETLSATGNLTWHTGNAKMLRRLRHSRLAHDPGSYSLKQLKVHSNPWLTPVA